MKLRCDALSKTAVFLQGAADNKKQGPPAIELKVMGGRYSQRPFLVWTQMVQ